MNSNSVRQKRDFNTELAREEKVPHPQIVSRGLANLNINNDDPACAGRLSFLATSGSQPGSPSKHPQKDFESLNSSLIRSSQDGEKEQVQKLLLSGADPNFRDKSGESALQCALKGNHDNIAKLLLNNGHVNQEQIEQAINKYPERVYLQKYLSANTNSSRPIKNNPSPPETSIDLYKKLYKAAQANMTEEAKSIISKITNPSELEYKKDLGYVYASSALFAADHGNREILEALITRDRELNSKNSSMTPEPLPIIDRMVTTSSAWSNLNPLMYLSGEGKNEQVQILLSVGANPNLFNGFGDSALLLAAAGGHHDVVKTLLQKGADPNHRKGNKDNDNALLLALKGKHDEVVRALFESGKEIDKKLIKAARKSFPDHPVLKKYLNVKVTRF